MSFTSRTQSPINTPLPSPLINAPEKVTPTKVKNLLRSDIQADTFTSPVKSQSPFTNRKAPKGTPIKGKRSPSPSEEAKKKEYRNKLENAWSVIIDEMLADEDDKAIIGEALEESKAAAKGLHDEAISRKYPTEKSLENTIKLMLFLKRSSGLSLKFNQTGKEKDEKCHFLNRTLQDGTAGACLTAFQEFFGIAPTSSTTVVKDKVKNNLNLLKEIPPNDPTDEARYLAIPMDLIEKNLVIAPASIIALKKTTFENRLNGIEAKPPSHKTKSSGHKAIPPRYEVVVNRKTGEPITRYEDLSSS